MNRRSKIVLLLFSAVLLVMAAGTYLPVRGAPPLAIKVEQGGIKQELSPGEIEDFLIEQRRVNINTATASELQAVPGIGEKTAAKIIEYRDFRGPFLSGKDLMNIKGIGEKKVEKMREHIKFR